MCSPDDLISWKKEKTIIAAYILTQFATKEKNWEKYTKSKNIAVINIKLFFINLNITLQNKRYTRHTRHTHTNAFSVVDLSRNIFFLVMLIIIFVSLLRICSVY